ncbi:Phage-related protein [Mariprofundus ferrinatatus]|uniref:Phage-related protein n=1 Tax=Mariprofundus ferrinatatus TaxID=1921087 RepID=A0A2K8LCG9_9PROT|nr:type II toxin-antitoxin system RelE/ParE family toxin [Mariprofundus ferrinatatus]ATX81986.1 Phage-related protein [Mariprofundus ferrinatatus]
MREWLKGLDLEDRKVIGRDIQTVQFGWPIGMPLVDNIERDIWEVRSKMKNGIGRVLFAMIEGEIVLLHGFVKKTQATPDNDKKLARNRLKEVKGEK